MLELKEKKAVLNLYDNSTVKWEDEGKRYCLHIRQDSESGNPREWEDNIDIMACWHRNYSLGDKVSDKTPEEFWRRLLQRRDLRGGESRKAVWHSAGSERRRAGAD